MDHDETNQSSLPQDEYDAWLRAKILGYPDFSVGRPH